jgi:DNA-directed RNA polymerase subunit M/transcription elongation factor TFIIS
MEKGNKHGNWKGGFPKCIGCGKQLTNYRSKRCRSCETKKRPHLKGINSFHWKGGLPKCINCGKLLSTRKVKNYEPKLCQKCNLENQKGKNHPMYGIHRFGEKSPNYKDGRTPITIAIRNSIRYKQWKQEVRIKKDFTCKSCHNKGGKLHVHHKKLFSILLEEIKYNFPLLDLYEGAMQYTPMWDVENGEVYCEDCHKEEHKRLKKLNGREQYDVH